jgi:hypothetical protein
MADERRADLASAGEQVDHAAGHARLDERVVVA